MYCARSHIIYLVKNRVKLFFTILLNRRKPAWLRHRVGNIVTTRCLIALSARNSSDRLFLQFVSGSKASIFVRKTLQVFPCEIKKALAFLSSQKRSAFFDEDDVCGRSQELRCSLSELNFGYRHAIGAAALRQPRCIISYYSRFFGN